MKDEQEVQFTLVKSDHDQGKNSKIEKKNVWPKMLKFLMFILMIHSKKMYGFAVISLIVRMFIL